MTSRRSRARSIKARPRSAIDCNISPKKEVFTGTRLVRNVGRINSNPMTNSQIVPNRAESSCYPAMDNGVPAGQEAADFHPNGGALISRQRGGTARAED